MQGKDDSEEDAVAWDPTRTYLGYCVQIAEVLTYNFCQARGTLKLTNEPDQGVARMPEIPRCLQHRLDVPLPVERHRDWMSWFPKGRCPTVRINLEEKGRNIYDASEYMDDLD